ncbi:MAG: hypothetical protein GXN93_03970 [Candidatus Diapherotrites archaeon]|nr:hypothetical protein [Candidatus Diapherotrites archaeon]
MGASSKAHVSGDVKMWGLVLVIAFLLGIGIGYIFGHSRAQRMGTAVSEGTTSNFAQIQSKIYDTIYAYYTKGGDAYPAVLAATTYYGLLYFFGNEFNADPRVAVLAGAVEVKARNTFTFPANAISALPAGPCKDLLFAVKNASVGEYTAAAYLYGTGKACNLLGSKELKAFYESLLPKP